LKNIRANPVTKYNPLDNEGFIDTDLIKIENDIFDNKVKPYNCDGLLDITLFPFFESKLKSKFVKFDKNVFSFHHKTHLERVAYIIELPLEILSDEKKVNQFQTALL
jgi:hypothetical protein